MDLVLEGLGDSNKVPSIVKSIDLDAKDSLRQNGYERHRIVMMNMNTIIVDESVMNEHEHNPTWMKDTES